jgi:hypothetical protein
MLEPRLLRDGSKLLLAHSGDSADRTDADTTSYSHQAATMGLRWFGIEDLHQWGMPATYNVPGSPWPSAGSTAITITITI